MKAFIKRWKSLDREDKKDIFTYCVAMSALFIVGCVLVYSLEGLKAL